jgi:hypothetical protein
VRVTTGEEEKTLISIQVAFDLFLGIAVLNGFALIEDFLTLAESDLHLRVSLFGEEDAERDDGISFFFYFIFELAELTFGKQELAVMYGKMVVGGAKAIFCDMHIAHPKFAFEKDAKTIHEVDFPIPDRFHFSADQYHTCIEFVLDEIIVVGGAILYFFCVWNDLKFINDVFLFFPVEISEPVVVIQL